jgi:hypothetical protein
MRRRHACLALAACLPLSALAQTPAPPGRFATPEWNLRLRHEAVDDAAFPHDASATTLRLRLGVRLQWADHWSALAEGEGIAAAADDYDSTANGRRGYPQIADAQGAEFNQAWIAWKGTRAQATLGRQRLQFGNQRWLGNSGWRQNEQTFDALSLDGRIGEHVALRYAWLDRVHRVNGDQARDPLARERNLDTHALELAWTPDATWRWTGYALWHEDRDVPTASTATAGVRGAATFVRDGRGPALAFEYATQRDHAGNPLHFTHAYWLLEPAYTWAGATYRAGWEHLGGNGRHALQTPLATLHAFNGWADKFAAATPPGGLEDRYVSASGKLGTPACEWALAWHDYRADRGPRYGSEWNASFGFPVRGALTGLIKLADYRADGFARDTTKAWLQFEWKH